MMLPRPSIGAALLLLSMISHCRGLSIPEPLTTNDPASSRRGFLEGTASLAGLLALASNPETASAAGGGLDFKTAASGIQWADAKVGTGTPLQKGATATIDYSMSTTGARYGTKIYSTQQAANSGGLDGTAGGPYRWTLGDGTTIAGIEEAILGSDTLEAMRPGGIRRLIVPQNLAYAALAEDSRNRCVANGTPGPIPPPATAFEEYQRFKNIYCNPSRQYQPDLVLDVKLYGAR